MREKAGVVKFVKWMKRLFVLFSVIAIPAFMVLCVFCFNTQEKFVPLFACLAAAVGLLWLVVYGFYAMYISMGAVLGIDVTDKVVHIKTKRKTFTYDVKRGCVAVKVSKRAFKCTFQTQDSRDNFTFYRHAPFTKYSDEQFTERDIAAFYPDVNELL